MSNAVEPIKRKRDIERMKQALSGRDLLLFTLGINTLLRISDLLSLNAEDVQGDYLEVYEEKTGKYKKIKLNAAAKKAIRDLAPESGPLFPSRKGDKPISRVQAYRVLNAAADRANLKIRFGCHSMRKTGGYFTYQRTKDIALVMKMLNHSSAKETLRYIGIEQENIDDSYDALCL